MNEICKICGANTEEIIHEQFRLNYYYCNECEFISKDNRSIVTPEEELKIYNNHNNSIEDPRYVEFFRKFLDNAILNYCSNGRKGFDFGSGPSPVLAMILERDYHFSMDIYDLFYSPHKIYEGQKYDLVTSTEVVEHLLSPLQYFHQFKHLLKEDSILGIMTLFHPKDEESFVNWHYVRDMSHISFYTPKTMEVIAEKVGLKIIHTDFNRYTTFKLL